MRIGGYARKSKVIVCTFVLLISSYAILFMAGNASSLPTDKPAPIDFEERAFVDIGGGYEGRYVTNDGYVTFNCAIGPGPNASDNSNPSKFDKKSNGDKPAIMSPPFIHMKNLSREAEVIGYTENNPGPKWVLNFGDGTSTHGYINYSRVNSISNWRYVFNVSHRYRGKGIFIATLKFYKSGKVYVDWAPVFVRHPTGEGDYYGSGILYCYHPMGRYTWWVAAIPYHNQYENLKFRLSNMPAPPSYIPRYKVGQIMNIKISFKNTYEKKITGAVSCFVPQVLKPMISRYPINKWIGHAYTYKNGVGRIDAYYPFTQLTWNFKDLNPNKYVNITIPCMVRYPAPKVNLGKDEGGVDWRDGFAPRTWHSYDTYNPTFSVVLHIGIAGLGKLHKGINLRAKLPFSIDNSIKMYKLTTFIGSGKGYMTVNYDGKILKFVNNSYYLFPGGSIITLRAHPDSGYKFSHWSGDYIYGTGGHRITASVFMDRDKNVTTYFVKKTPIKRNFTLRVVVPICSGYVHVDPPGVDAAHGRPNTFTYREGTIVTLKAHPFPGYRFDHWSGDASGNDPNITVGMDSNKTIVAHFEKTRSGTTDNDNQNVSEGNQSTQDNNSSGSPIIDNNSSQQEEPSNSPPADNGTGNPSENDNPQTPPNNNGNNQNNNQNTPPNDDSNGGYQERISSHSRFREFILEILQRIAERLNDNSPLKELIEQAIEGMED